MKTIVMKFGGTSVGNAEAIGQAADLIRQESERWSHMVVVVSAMRGVTDALIDGALTAAQGDEDTYRGVVSDLRVRHTLAVAKLISNPDSRTSLLKTIDAYL
ncbi:MAG: aspartate kinase, partial [Anaerolineae bacterium]|nr:aspartate kinase [Anaerolineae bacterium]